MRTLLNFIRSQFKRPLVFPVAIGALTLIAQIASIAGTLHNSSAAWERTAVSGLETLARWLDGEAVRGPGAEARPGDGIAWSDFDKKLSGIESGLPPSFQKGQEMKRVEALIWEARGHASDLRSATDPGKRKRIEEKWRAAVSLAEANLNLFSARLRARPGATIEATRSVHARDLALGALGIVSLLGALLWRFALSPQADKRSATLPRAAGSDFSLVAYRLSRDAIIAADHAGNVCAMNSSAEKMLGAPATCFIGKPLAKIVPAPDGELLEPRAVVATHHSGASIPVEMIYRRLRGRSRRASMAILRPRTSQALVPAAAPPAPAPTTAARLQADSTLLADLLSHCPAPLVVFDTSGRMLHFNRACFEATGYSVADVRDEPYWKVALGGEDAEMERRSWEAGVPLRHSRSVLQNWRTARGPVWFEWSWSVFRDGDGKPMFVVAIGAEVSPRARPVRAAIEAAVA